ncbi:hypothetical protein QBC36DRAFT_360959 [Triangularia setosa]|uniref:Uncharacterized protein n=1 Tax=Triangularia setosa TaxID=2587417 RepID=A0AAN6W187_9PEZI|nr:hypothetical protein QBC36DRAFT_360959 [Podospora setosa]
MYRYNGGSLTLKEDRRTDNSIISVAIPTNNSSPCNEGHLQDLSLNCVFLDLLSNFVESGTVEVPPFTLRTLDRVTLQVWQILPLELYRQHDEGLVKESEGNATDITKRLGFQLLRDDPESRLVLYLHAAADVELLMATYRVAGTIPLLGPLAPFPRLLAFFSNFIVSKWPSKDNIAAFVSQCEEMSDDD